MFTSRPNEKKKNKILNTSHNRRSSILVIHLLVSCLAFSQQNPVETGIRDAFKLYRSGYVGEKLYVHTDKNFYVPGEILWFRIYDVDASFHRPLSISKIAYVELLDPSNRSLLQEKISLRPGEEGGSFIIPVTIPSGNYRFRAYTRWMRNFGVDYFFEKNICIANPQLPVNDSANVKPEKYDIQFFPEGGDLIEKVESKVGFRITNAYGRGLNATGVLVDNLQDTLLKFQTLKVGLGHFVFIPAANRLYKAIIYFEDKSRIVKDLPLAHSSGYRMRLEHSNGGRLSVNISTAGIPDQTMVYLFVHTRGLLKKSESGKLLNGKADFSINPEELGAGISQFTVFNYEGRPVCERLYFKYPEKKLKIDASSGQREFSVRKEVDLNLSSTNPDGKPEMADMSMSVYRLDSLQRLDEMDISHYLYLVSDLGAGIESPEYYFNGDSSEREPAMDNLMLTHGWRRFAWQEVLQRKSADIRFSPEYYGHILEGKLVDNKTGAAVPEVNAYLSVPSTRAQFRVTTSDSAGHVKFELKDFYDSREIVLQTNPKDDSSCHFEMESPFSRKYSGNLPGTGYTAEINSPALLDHTVQAQVQRIYNGANLQQFKMPVIDTSAFYMKPDEKYLLDDFVRFQTMEEVLREYVVSTNVVKKRDKLQLYVFDNDQRRFFAREPLILLDGVPIFEADKLFRQDPLKIRRLDLVASEYFLGYQSFEGIINCTTYHGDLDGFEMDPHATVLDYPGIPAQRQFFVPQYETEQQVNSRIPDFRTVLYWTPQIKTDVQGKAKASFYTSDLPGKYAVVIQGITASGESGSRVIYFSVKK